MYTLKIMDNMYIYIYVPWSSYVGFMVLSLWSSITCQEFPVPSCFFKPHSEWIFLTIQKGQNKIHTGNHGKQT